MKIRIRIDKKWETISGFMLLEVPPSKIQNLVVAVLRIHDIVRFCDDCVFR